MVEDNEFGWQSLPDVLLEDIFGLLSIKEKHIASQVCKHWFHIFYSSKVWAIFVLNDETLTKRKYNYYLGYERTLDHYRTQIFLNRVGHQLKKIIIKPMVNFFNLYEFMKILSYFAEFYDQNPLRKVNTFDFTFSCHQLLERDGNQETVFGTGGKLLQSLMRLLRNLKGLLYLSLRDLLLEPSEAQYLLDDVAINCCQTLKSLTLLNCSKILYPILHVGVFLNLKNLVISPQHLSDDIVVMLSDTKLQDLWIVQNKYTEYCQPISSKTWRSVSKHNPLMRIHLVVTGKVNSEIVWQESESVKSVIYDSPIFSMKSESLFIITSMYSSNLEHLAFHGLPRYHMSNKFSQRADTSLVLLSQMCPNLKTLIIRELISTATLLVIITSAQQLTQFIVRKNAIIKRFDWKQQTDWSDHYYQWIKYNSTSYERTFDEISKIMGKKWLPLTDDEFKRIHPNNRF
ncbi:uncharacterized protein LOC128960302 [Oppia nitens]|uniref:uncharacterized protein LOC128960302 n=1 Tax=Oppia nitens TaxID=1686743 RepID=UPI0023DBEAD8|nr:uncharacterized protein LOC128960302 [Oppia nitens]